jgi:hypothetical protein
VSKKQSDLYSNSLLGRRREACTAITLHTQIPPNEDEEIIKTKLFVMIILV